MTERDWIVPDWPAPVRVQARMTTRDGGVSTGPWAGSSGGGLNLGLGSGDDPTAVLRNRRLVADRLPSEPAWLRQVHGTAAVDLSQPVEDPIIADASFTATAGRVCAILVADCLPVLFTDRRGSRVAAAHAGWRGLAGGVLESTLVASGLAPDETLAWIGPAIGPTRFEVGDDVRLAFVVDAVPAAAACFAPLGAGKWLADLPRLARLRLEAAGVSAIHASGLCTASDRDRFYSYRRDGTTGRQAALIWLDH